MFSQYLRQVLILNQGEKLSESAAMLFAVPVTGGNFVVLCWDEFLKSFVSERDYIFPQNFNDVLGKQVERSLGIMQRMRPVFETDPFNKAIDERRHKTLSTLKQVLDESVPDQNLFVESWLKKRASENGETLAWEMYIERLADALAFACDIKKQLSVADISDATNKEYAQLVADVVCVNHYMPRAPDADEDF